MAAPFFQIRVDEKPARKVSDKKGLTEYEVYHLFMQAYPAYTVNKIEQELSWRLVEKLVDCWEDQKPLHLRLEKIETVLKVAFKIKDKPIIKRNMNKERTADDDKKLLDTLRGYGWL